MNLRLIQQDELKGNQSVIAAGTGLEKQFYLGWSTIILLSEEGTDFAIATALQDELLQWMRYRYGGHVLWRFYQ
jgi:hypothetical protein